MSLNDKDVTLGGNKAVDQYPGVANPTTASVHPDPLAANLVTDPTTEEFGAGVGGNFMGHKEAARNFSKTSGVVEGRPGIIESTNIDPLNENSNKDDGWANVSQTGPASADARGTATGYVSSAAGVAAGAARLAYGHVAGDEQAKQAGKEAVWGKE